MEVEDNSTPQPERHFTAATSASSSSSSLPSALDAQFDGSESSDDELEVLLVIQPPTPKRPKPRKQQREETQQQAPLSTNRSTEKKTPSPLNINCNGDKIRPSSPTAKHIPVTPSSSKVAAVISKLPSKNQHTSTNLYETSAYVQNLAEMCFQILWDRRWRVFDLDGHNSQRLFAWEFGDDLSAIITLSDMYTPRNTAVPKKKMKRRCKCLLCSSSEINNVSIDDDENNSMIQASKEKHNNRIEMKANDENKFHHKTTSDDADNGTDNTDYARAINLYCRLFYRKGPWFRLDDIYSRYYASQNTSTSNNHSLLATSRGEITSDKNSDQTEEQINSTDKNCSNSTRNNFFLPKAKNQNGIASENNRQGSGHARRKNDEDNLIDKKVISENIDSITRLLKDISHLRRLGLIRCFVSEEECGKAAGALNEKGTGLLSSDERKQLLEKLGRGGKSNAKVSGTKRPNPNNKENEIWKQMCSQQSISLSFSGNNKKTRLLPVRRHLNLMVLDKLSKKIVLSSSHRDYLPATFLREQVSEISQKILNASKDIDFSSGLELSFCLREKPLRTLRRLVRLYMCATGGPGSMRSDGTNGWKSLLELDYNSINDVPMSNYVQLPGANSWSNIVYPGLMHRFGLSAASFFEAYEFRPCKTPTELENDDIPRTESKMEYVFSSVHDFHAWEATTELRSNVDYLIEANDLIHYQERKRARESNMHSTRTESNCSGEMANDVSGFTSDCSCIDFLDVLSERGRLTILKSLLRSCQTNECEILNQVQSDVEKSVIRFNTTNENLPEKQLSGITPHFTNGHEKILGIISQIAVHALIARHRYGSSEAMSMMAARPWLRHLWWEGVLAYLLWDCIPLLEKRGFYDLALTALEVLLFGTPQPQKLIPGIVDVADLMRHPSTTPLAQILISRRARGKAYDRLVIDYTHIFRIHTKFMLEDQKNKSNVKITNPKRKRKKKKGEEKKTDIDLRVKHSPTELISQFCVQILEQVVSTGSISFSSLRSLARRTKLPLVELLKGKCCLEAIELGLRLDSTAEHLSSEGTFKSKNNAPSKYRDWTPIIDHATAKAINKDGPTIGSRCSFAGFEDDESKAIFSSSLNVEELAMEYYATGRLPTIVNSSDSGDSNVTGGWVGWHDEGGHVRALFRILSSNAVLGMDGGCCNDNATNGNAYDETEYATIFLTPYQGAPSDLHVGHSAYSSEFSCGMKGNTYTRGFYERRRGRIEAFLTKLESLDKQTLCNIVHDSIVERWHRLGPKEAAKDTLLQRDLSQVRTLSMLCAGFGGKLMSSIFRCLFFDYRHFSGGLPDLLLVRALLERTTTQSSIENNEQNLVELGEWVGEDFRSDIKAEKEMTRRRSLLFGADDEFLACDKVGDSAASSGGRWGRNNGNGRYGSQSQQPNTKGGDNSVEDNISLMSINDLPPKLLLVHNGCKVNVECMFVEVKSSNDRLDGRQEDWLNVLDRNGNARVCKFGDNPGKSNAKKKS